MKRKLLSIMLCIALMLAMAVPAFADDEPRWIEGETIVVDLTYEEFIAKTAELNGISEEEAVQLYKNIREADKCDGPIPYVDMVEHYQSVSRTFTYSKNRTYSASSEATVLLLSKGPYVQIEGVSGCATRISSGTSTASWVQLYNSYDGSFPGTSVTFIGRGYFTESRTSTVGGGINLEGFTMNGTIGSTTTYSSDSMDLIWTYKVYP